MSTDKSLEALLNLNPKFILRYSATHKETYNKLYCLNPVDAVQKNLVKKIFVEAISIRKTFINIGSL